MSELGVGDWLRVRELARELGGGKIAPGSTRDLRDQAELYFRAMGPEATERQLRLRADELTAKRKRKPTSR